MPLATRSYTNLPTPPEHSCAESKQLPKWVQSAGVCVCKHSVFARCVPRTAKSQGGDFSREASRCFPQPGRAALGGTRCTETSRSCQQQNCKAAHGSWRGAALFRRPESSCPTALCSEPAPTRCASLLWVSVGPWGDGGAATAA